MGALRWLGRRRAGTGAFDVIGTLFPLDPQRPILADLGLPPFALEA